MAYTQKQFNEDVATATEAAAAYYDTDIQLIPDVQYDEILVRIEAGISTHPNWNADVLLNSVAAGASTGGNVNHPEPMLSLAKAKNISDINEFVKKSNSALVVETKLDGLAVRCKYVDGNLVLVATRGDGTTGEDVTAQAQNINGLPLKLKSALTIEVRGEVFMTDEDFTTASNNRVAAGKNPFANPRNATAGTLRNEDLTYVAPMSFAAYEANGHDFDSDSYLARMKIVNKAGIAAAVYLTPSFAKLTSNASDITSIINSILEVRPTLGFPIDGAVVKVDSLIVRDKIGSISQTPRWAVAYKYPADTATSILRSIEISVGRTGRLGLRGVIDPVNVAGTTITYASVHNIPWVKESGILINGTVTVYRAGDVIPRITAPANGEQPIDAYEWVSPTACPQCNEPLDMSSLLYRCVTPECSIVGRIEYAASRDCLDIEGLGVEIADALVEAGLVNNIADLYDLTVQDIANVQIGLTSTGADRLIGGTVAKKLAAEIEKSKNQPFNRIISALGIRKTGRTMGRRLAAKFPTMELLSNATTADLMQVEGIAIDKAEYIHSGLSSMQNIIAQLALSGVNMGEETNKSKGGNPLAGKTYVISGSIPGFSRTQAQEKIEMLGGKASSSVSAHTTALITNETQTAKAVKASALGIPIIDPAEFAKTLV